MTHICRICLDYIDSTTIIKPCICTEGYFHKDCLKRWILEKKSENCEICLTKYKNLIIKKQFDYKNNSVIICINLYIFVTGIFIWIYFFLLELDPIYYMIPPIYTIFSIIVFYIITKFNPIQYKLKIYFDP